MKRAIIFMAIPPLLLLGCSTPSGAGDNKPNTLHVIEEQDLGNAGRVRVFEIQGTRCVSYETADGNGAGAGIDCDFPKR